MKPLKSLLDSLKEGRVDMDLVERIRKSEEAKRSIRGRLHGRLFRISSTNLEDFEGRASDKSGYVTSNFKDHYQHHMAAMQTVALSAKLYLVKHWGLVKDWSELNVVVMDNTGYATEYCSFKPRDRKRTAGQGNGIVERMLSRLDALDAQRHNPVVSVSDVVLDLSDEDFSININGNPHLWISDESVVVIAAYVEEQLKKQTEATGV